MQVVCAAACAGVGCSRRLQMFMHHGCCAQVFVHEIVMCTCGVRVFVQEGVVCTRSLRVFLQMTLRGGGVVGETDQCAPRAAGRVCVACGCACSVC